MATIYMVMDETFEGPDLEEVFVKKEAAEKYIALMNRDSLYIEEKETKDEYWEKAEHDYYKEMGIAVILPFTKEKILEEKMAMKTNVYAYDALFNPKREEPYFHMYLDLFGEEKLVNFSLRVIVSDEKEKQEEVKEMLMTKIKEWMQEAAETLIKGELLIKNKSSFLQEKRKNALEPIYKKVEYYLKKEFPKLVK